MMTKMTIELENSLLDKLIYHAQMKGATVSDVIKKHLETLPFSTVEDKEKPISSRLRGVIKLPKDFDYKKELENKEL